MKIKFFVQDGEDNELLLEKQHTFEVSTMILCAKSHYIESLLYDVIESVLDMENEEIQITLEER